jgi:osmotically-inducible protein OsmY
MENLTNSLDQQSIRMVKQAFKDDQALSAVADDIRVTVEDGAITLAGQVGNEQQINLATNTAAAFEGVDKLKTKVVNNMTIDEAFSKT